MAITKKTERSFQILESVSAINVMVTTIIVDDDVEISRSNHGVSFDKNQRALFIEQFPDAVAYADLAGLVDPEPVAPVEQVAEPAA